MSSKNNLPNSKEEVKKYIESISKIPYVDKIYLVGSRSPLSKKSSRVESDWDFKIISSLKTLKLPHPRRDLQLIHADIVMLYELEAIKSDKKAVEVYPNDVYKIFENA